PTKPNPVAAVGDRRSTLIERRYDYSRNKKRINDGALDQYSRRQQAEHDPTIACRPRLVGTDFLPNKESDGKDRERERHVGANERCQSRAEEVKAECGEGDQPGGVSGSARCVTKQQECNERCANK